jgi:hypothetical protein
MGDVAVDACANKLKIAILFDKISLAFKFLSFPEA